jgi:hypothetical protein
MDSFVSIYKYRGFTMATCQIVNRVMTNLDVQHRLILFVGTVVMDGVKVDLDAYVVSPKIQLVELLSTWLFHVRNLVRGCLRDLQSVCILAHGKLSIMG